MRDFRTLRRLMYCIAVLSVASLSILAPQARSALVTFDDLRWTPTTSDPDFSDQPITNQYASLGMVVDGGYLAQSEGRSVSEPHFLLGGNGMTINFTGSLPTHVSLYLTSPYDGVEAWVDAAGPGFSARASTGGYAGGPIDEPPATPYVPNTLATFTSAAGISRLTFDNYYFGRISAFVDNVYFGAVPAVSEPGTLALVAAGLACIAGWRRRPYRLAGQANPTNAGRT